jgi:hypothetical protein
MSSRYMYVAKGALPPVTMGSYLSLYLLRWKLPYRKKPPRNLTSKMLPRATDVPTCRCKAVLILNLIRLLQATSCN